MGDVGRHEAGITALRFRYEGHCGTDLTGGAVTALKSVVLDECRLHRMQFFAFRESFDRRDVIAFMHDRETETRIDPSPVHQDRARAALPVIAAFLRASELQIFT